MTENPGRVNDRKSWAGSPPCFSIGMVSWIFYLQIVNAAPWSFWVMLFQKHTALKDLDQFPFFEVF
jgi:dolichol kinase